MTWRQQCDQQLMKEYHWLLPLTIISGISLNRSLNQVYPMHLREIISPFSGNPCGQGRDYTLVIGERMVEGGGDLSSSAIMLFAAVWWGYFINILFEESLPGERFPIVVYMRRILNNKRNLLLDWQTVIETQHSLKILIASLSYINIWGRGKIRAFSRKYEGFPQLCLEISIFYFFSLERKCMLRRNWWPASVNLPIKRKDLPLIAAVPASFIYQRKRIS